MTACIIANWNVSQQQDQQEQQQQQQQLLNLKTAMLAVKILISVFRLLKPENVYMYLYSDTLLS